MKCTSLDDALTGKLIAFINLIFTFA